ncbi:hypothetical protein DKX38_020298 [Salix brachista]|uniref:peroxidase n=1 Tax=Salix brachista TaxID=2182728 RepID=A0A5N5KIR5_9ROSI|nr:hypothetical protein DKX38_020298 [Salix brachista]
MAHSKILYGLCFYMLLLGLVHAQLSTNFYAATCPNALSAIRTAVLKAVSKEHRMGASLLRLHFHDCFLSGPSWTVQLGRRDSTTASFAAANSDLPSPLMDLSDLITSFSNKGFTAKEMVALSGSHTIGQARCLMFRNRVYNETTLDSTLATSLKSSCPGTGSDDSLSSLDAVTPVTFDNSYFKNLANNKGLLHSDQQLFSGGTTDSQVKTYSLNSATFYADFAKAMVKMGSISPLTGSDGQIRTNCAKVN